MTMNGIYIPQLVAYVVRPVLEKMDMASIDALRLVMGTGLVESRLQYLDQIERGGDNKPGPAYGIFQMERATHDDILQNFVAYHPSIEGILKLYTPVLAAERMQGNLYYAAAMCRLHYRRVRESVPSTPEGMAQYWKKYYNSYLGAGDPREALPHFQAMCTIIK